LSDNVCGKSVAAGFSLPFEAPKQAKAYSTVLPSQTLSENLIIPEDLITM
jgi:hypothetical protein